MGVTRASIYCRRCSYVLDGLDRERCPECGNAYDPANRATYETMPRWARWRRRLFRCCIVLVVVGALGGAGYAACRIPPSLRVVEVKESDSAGGHQATLVLTNRSLASLWYSGDSKSFPLYERRHRAPDSKTWTNVRGGWCRTGVQRYRLMPGESVTFSAWISIRYLPSDSMQVGLPVWHPGQNAGPQTVWSDTFSLSGADQSDVKATTAGHSATKDRG
ncbi:MAG: hypothetical protein ACYSTY_03820 [Planctomycetota bacterium]|jgi:hypothetical protein